MANNNAALASKLAAKGAQMTPLAIKDELKSWKEKNFAVMAQLLGDKDKAERLYIATCYAISQVPKLAECSKQSLINCMMQSCYTGLFPGALQECDYLPYKGVATFVPRYGGLVGLAEQTGLYSGFSANVVYEADEFDFQEGSDPYLKHRKSLGSQKERGERVAAYASCKSTSGTPIFVILTMDEVESIKKRAPGGSSSYSPWNNSQEFDYDEMCKKTALKRLCKLLKKSPELAKAIEVDNEGERPDLSKPTIPGFGEFDAVGVTQGAPLARSDEAREELPAIAAPAKKSHYLEDQPGWQQEQELAEQEAFAAEAFEPEVEAHISAIAPAPVDAKETMERVKQRAESSRAKI